MTFWLVLAILTAAVALAVLVPLSRAPKVHPEERNDEAVFRAQLDEIQKDLERGVIAPDMAEAAKIEVSRRLLSAHKQNEAEQNTSVLSKLRLRIVQATAIVLIPLSSLGLYMQFGSPEVPDQPRAERLAVQNGKADIQVLIAKTEEHLKNNPDDGQGWAVIAPVYMRSGQFEKARRAFANALRQYSNNTALMLVWAEASIFANDGQVSAASEKVLTQFCVANPHLIQPYYYLALELGQKGEINRALDAWNSLLSGADQNAPWVPSATQERERLIANGAVASTPEPELAAPRGPSAEDVQAASELSDADRKDMINQMVAQLSERLADEGGSAGEWARLIQARVILGEQAQAVEALSQARKNLKDDAAALDQINQLAASLALEPAQ